jgi:DnaJ-class molecular chaperone
MPLGYCPFCTRSLAPSAEVCPACGNTDFRFRTGETRGFVSQPFDCRTCKGKGAIQNKTVRYEECPECGGRGFHRPLFSLDGDKKCKTCGPRSTGSWGPGAIEIVTATTTTTCTSCNGTGREHWERKEWALVDTRSCQRSWLPEDYSYMATIGSIDPEWKTRFGEP